MGMNAMSAQITHPTPYPDVNALLHELRSSVQTLLGDHLIGMYLYGSLASGDFDSSSDIDFVAVTDGEMADDLFSALQTLHTRIAASDSRWATELEGSYIPQHALRRYDPAHAWHPHIDRGCVALSIPSRLAPSSQSQLQHAGPRRHWGIGGDA